MEFLFGDMDMERVAATATVQATVEGALPLPGGRRLSETELMCFEGAVSVTKVTASAGAVTVEGRVRVELVCRGSAGEAEGGELFAFASGAAFRYSAAVPGAQEGMAAEARAKLVALEIRQGVELNLEALLELECTAFEAKPMRTLTGVKGCPVEFSHIPIQSVKEKALGAGVTTLREEAELKGACRVLSARGECAVREVSCGGDSASVEGQLFVTILYQGEQGPESTQEQFPFQMEVALDDRPAGECFAEVAVEGIEARLLEGMEGLCGIQVRMGAVIRCYEACGTTAPKDAYLPGAAMGSVKGKAAFLCRGKRRCFRHAVMETIPLTEGMPAAAGAVCCSVRPLVTGASAAEGTLMVEGVLFLRSVLRTAAGELLSFPAEIPFACDTPCGGEFDRAFGEARCLDACLSAEGDRVMLNCVLLVEATPYRLVETELVTGMEERECPPRRRAMVLYYAARGETLFDVGKRFSLPRAAIAQCNPDAAEELKEGQPLLFLSGR